MTLIYHWSGHAEEYVLVESPRVIYGKTNYFFKAVDRNSYLSMDEQTLRNGINAGYYTVTPECEITGKTCGPFCALLHHS